MLSKLECKQTLKTMFNICQKCVRKLLIKREFRPQLRLISVIFYGSDDFSLVTLKLLHQNFISQNNNKLITELHLVSGSKSNKVLKFGLKNQLICHEFPFRVPKDCYDIGVVASFGHLIPKSAINACRLGINTSFLSFKLSFHIKNFNN
jgi:hypothetical protein